uniref:Cytochrome P450 n=1 Tax=Amphimedon queenslandica TaxID=400682 RepID=A0A1X7TUE0_AMPQE
MDAEAPDDPENESSIKASRVLTDKQIVGLCFDFMLAGHDTTSSMLAFTSYLLAINPHEQEQLCQAIDDYYQENEIHMSPEYWDQPEVFNPKRFSPEGKEGRNPQAYIPFGSGPRSCIGMRFALMEAKACLVSILRKYRFERSPDTQEALPTRYALQRVYVSEMCRSITFPEGCRINTLILKIHMSPEYWDQPEVFNPKWFSPEGKEGRNPQAYIPFGSGPKSCIGMRFALMEAKACLVSILRKYRFERSPDTQIILSYRGYYSSLALVDYLYHAYGVLKRLGIPHPPVTPLMGNGIELLKMSSTDFQGKWIAKSGKVFGYYMGTKVRIVIADLDILKEIMIKQSSKFINVDVEPQIMIKIRRNINMGPGLSFEEGEEWKRVRRIITPTFSSKKLKLMMPLVDKSINSLISVLEDINKKGQSVNIQ